MTLLSNPRAAQAVDRIEDIKPLTCQSADRNNPIVVKKVAWIWITFREDRGKSESKLLGFCVVPESTESLIRGKPTLDAFRIVSNRHPIELQALDRRFPTVLPKVLPEAVSYTHLTLPTILRV